MLRLTLLRDTDGARLYIDIDPKQGQGYLIYCRADSVQSRTLITFGKPETLKVINAWHSGDNSRFSFPE